MNDHSGQLRKVNRRVRFVLDQVMEIAGDTKKGLRGRVSALRDAVDGK